VNKAKKWKSRGCTPRHKARERDALLSPLTSTTMHQAMDKAGVRSAPPSVPADQIVADSRRMLAWPWPPSPLPSNQSHRKHAKYALHSFTSFSKGGE
jgi:hypothetical protein